MLRVRASKCAALFTGTDGLTQKQIEALHVLMTKVKLTDNQAARRDELIAKRDAPITLGEGARTLIEEAIDEMIYDYKVSFNTREMTKGTDVEDESIEIYNRIFFTDYKKMGEEDDHFSLSFLFAS